MRCFWDDRQRGHRPQGEFFNGAVHPASEIAGRVDSILAAIGPTEAPGDRGMGPILRTHDPAYVEFLKSAHARWRDAGRDGDAFPYTFPVVGRRPVDLKRIDALLGRHSFDTSTPISPGTWEASYWSVQTALAGLDAVIGGEKAAFALTRPPGHHAGIDYCGGYSYLNTAAVAAEQAIALGRRSIAILDVDYHHGNGTQDIFLSRGDVAFASIHADPATDYPFYWGHPDESGDGAGEGATLNLPLPRGTGWDDYEPALVKALDWIVSRRPDLLIVSYGADTHEDDPISYFRLKTADYHAMGQRIAAIGLPTLVVMEGGYAVRALGANVATFIGGLDG